MDCDGPYDYDEVTEALQRVFGIVGICPVVRLEDQGFEQLKKDVVAYMDELYPDKNITFKVEARRSRKNYPKNSMEINCDIGEAILDAFPGIRVDVHHPDVMLNIEVREDIYVYSRIIPGPGGMPVGTNGKAMLLLSGGIDSPVAGYMIAKRGVALEATYFHAPPYTSERAKEKVVDLARIIAAYAGPIRLHVVNFTDIQLYIYDQCPHDDHHHEKVHDEDRGAFCEGGRLPGSHHRGEHRSGGKPDHAEPGGYQRGVHSAGVPSPDRI